MMESMSEREFDGVAFQGSSASDVSLSAQGSLASDGFVMRISPDPSNEYAVTPRFIWHLPIKAIFDFIAAVVLLILTGPATLLAAILVKMTSPGPAFYSQVRVGLNGRHFTLYKLRTMVNNAEAASGAVWCSGNDLRITPLGMVLRSTHIDEFPQLLNVICGQMSLIGPRPERPEFTDRLDWEIPHYRERLRIRPGITGLAQLRLPPDTNLESVRRKLICDLYYIQNMNPWLDFQLIVATGWSLVRELWRHTCRFVSLPSPKSIENGFQQAVGTALTETVVE